MPGELKLHVLTRSDVERGEIYASCDESICEASPAPAKRRALLSNPYGRDPALPMQVIGVRDGRVIGRIDLVAGELLADGTPHTILWGSGFWVPPEERKSMMGAMLLMKAQASFPLLGANGPSQMALPLYEKLKWVTVPLKRYIFLRRSRSVVKRYVGGGPIGAAARIVGDAGLLGVRAAAAARRALRASGLRLTRTERAPNVFDASFAVSRPGVRGARSAAWLDWLLQNHFGASGRHERSLHLIETGGGEPLGYILMKVKHYEVATSREIPDLTLATLADWWSLDERRLPYSSVLLHAIALSGMLGSDALEVCEGHTISPALFRSMGFVPAGVMSGVWRAAPGSALASETYKDPASWTLRYADGESVPS